MKPYELKKITYELLDASPESVTAIARNADLNYHWLVAFHSNRELNPGVDAVAKLCKYLMKADADRRKSA